MSKTPNTPSLDFSPPMKPKEETGAEFKARQVAKAQEAAEAATELKDAPDTWQALEKAQEEGKLVLQNIPEPEVLEPQILGRSEQFNLRQREAKALSASDFMPDKFKNSIPNCLLALELAYRTGYPPLQVAQNIYIVQGKPSISTQFLMAMFNRLGKFSDLRYKWENRDGKKEDMTCYAYATDLQSGEELRGTKITWAMVVGEGWNSKAGSKWNTMPEQMFQYRAAKMFISIYASDLVMGMSTEEEAEDIASNNEKLASSATKALADTFKK